MRKACKILSAFLGSFIILFVILAYSQYLTLKKTLIAGMSDKATALIGQKVELGDIFLDSTAGITISDIVIKSPDGFDKGDFLRIKKVRLDMRYRDLLKGKFSFRTIEVASPELSLMTAQDKLNISDKFRAFFSKKGTAEYLIDEFSIRNASISFNNEPLYRAKDMNLSMHNLSSVQGTKTSLKASLSFLGNNKMTAEGWVYLKDKAQKFDISAIADDINLSILKKHISKYGMDLDKSRASISFQAEGDTEQGIRIKAGTQLKETGMSIFRQGIKNSMSLTAEAFLDINNVALTVSKALFTTGDSSAIQAKGTIQGMSGIPSYSAEIKVDRLDLSSFNLMKGLKAGGSITSDLIKVKGTFSSILPKATGTMTISNGFVRMDKADIQGLNATIAFASEKDLSVKLGASARILNAGDVIFRQPVEMNLSAKGKGKPERVTFNSELTLSGIGMELKGKDIKAGHIHAAYDGTIQGKVVSGKVSLEGKDLTYDRYKAKDLRTDLAVTYDSKKVTVSNLRAVSDIFSAAGDIITVTMPRVRGKMIMEATNLSASYPDKKADLKGLDCTVSMSDKDKEISGDLSFTAQKVSFQDISSGSIAGKGSIANGNFMIDVPSAKLFNGSARILAKGRSAGSPFPVTVTLRSENIDLGLASQAAKLFFKTPYSASGSAQLLSFDGTISSLESVTGKASIRGKNISITNAQSRDVLKNAVVSSDMVFRGKDMDIKADASVAGLALSLSGTADRMFEGERIVRLSLLIPEVMVSDLRAAFWDIFPDQLLYAGLNGSIALNLLTTYSSNAVTAEGSVVLKDIALEGENREYSVGPVNGMLPVHYNSEDKGSSATSLLSFERTNFDELKKSFAGSTHPVGSEIRISSVRYGFRLFEDISAWVEQKGRSLKINRISAKMFGGTVTGTALLDLSDSLSYRAGIIADGVSLTQLCEEIPPIKGYISGRIDGIATIKGSGAGLGNIIGKADFWTYSAEGEKTRISKEFLEKIGGPQVRAYLGERKFDKGIMGLYIQKGFIIFRELEISNRNFMGITDLSVKVAPLNNRVSIDHLMWTMTEAAQRAKKE